MDEVVVGLAQRQQVGEHGRAAAGEPDETEVAPVDGFIVLA